LRQPFDSNQNACSGTDISKDVEPFDENFRFTDFNHGGFVANRLHIVKAGNQEWGILFLGPGVEIYTGMIIGQHAKENVGVSSKSIRLRKQLLDANDRKRQDKHRR